MIKNYQPVLTLVNGVLIMDIRKYLKFFFITFTQKLCGMNVVIQGLKKLFKFKLDERNQIIMVNIDTSTVSASWRVKQYILLLSFKKTM